MSNHIFEFDKNEYLSKLSSKLYNSATETFTEIGTLSKDLITRSTNDIVEELQKHHTIEKLSKIYSTFIHEETVTEIK